LAYRTIGSQEMVKRGYVERVGNAYRVTDKGNIPELQSKLQRLMDLVAETAKRLGGSGRFTLGDPVFVIAGLGALLAYKYLQPSASMRAANDVPCLSSLTKP
jgi:hypothetical protein